MAGRAGRRGLDSVGTVILACWEDVPEEGELRRLLTGRATKLESRFRLTYSMILNLMRVEELDVPAMLKRSFAEFHAQKGTPETLQALAECQVALACRTRACCSMAGNGRRPLLSASCLASADVPCSIAFALSEKPPLSPPPSGMELLGEASVRRVLKGRCSLIHWWHLVEGVPSMNPGAIHSTVGLKSMHPGASTAI
jgi:hypothetical protein